MSSWMGSSAFSANPSLAWSIGNAGKGRILIEFPLKLNDGWYNEQPCTSFCAFEHRKERKGFKHEFIVLKLEDGSICRVERMGDPNARFDALTPRGSVAYDTAQCFRPDELDQAVLDTSDILSEVTLPCAFDIIDVLVICRAIHEGEKTRNYTLQVYNCWFFSLAIQVCLTRLVAHWEDSPALKAWIHQTGEAIGKLPNTEFALGPSGLEFQYPVIFKLYSALSPCTDDNETTLMDKVKAELESCIRACPETVQKEIARRINSLLWYSSIGSSMNDFIEEEVVNSVTNVLKQSLQTLLSLDHGSDHAYGGRLSFLVALKERLGSSDIGKRNPYRLKPTRTKWKPMTQNSTAVSNSRESSKIELDFMGTPVQTINKTPSDLSSYLRHLIRICQRTRFDWGATPRTLATEMEHPKQDETGYPESGWFAQIASTLADNPASTWNSTWEEICRFIQQHTPNNIIEGVEHGSPQLIVRLEGHIESEAMHIPNFQKHVLKRIKIHATEVEKVRLGSATSIQTELISMLSNAWERIRVEDVNILDALVEVVQQIVGTSHISKCQSVIDFVGHVDAIMGNLISVLRNKGALHGTFRKDLFEIHKYVNTLLNQDPRLHSVKEPLHPIHIISTRILHNILRNIPYAMNEADVIQMGQQLANALDHLQFAVLLESLSRLHNTRQYHAANKRTQTEQHTRSSFGISVPSHPESQECIVNCPSKLPSTSHLAPGLAMEKRNSGIHGPSVASTMRSAVTALLGFVALPAIPLGSTLDRLVELVHDITNVTHSSRRLELMDFGEHVSAVVNRLVVVLRNEQFSTQANVRRNLQELQRQVQSMFMNLHLHRIYGIVLTGFIDSLRTLDKILRNIYYINSPRDFISRLRRALFPEDDQMHVVRMRQQLEDVMRLFQFAAACELLSRPQTLPQDDDSAQTDHVQKRQTRQCSGAFSESVPPILGDELATACQEMTILELAPATDGS